MAAPVTGVQLPPRRKVGEGEAERLADHGVARALLADGERVGRLRKAGDEQVKQPRLARGVAG